MATWNDVSLSLLGVASLLPGAWRSSSTSLMVAYWVAMLHSSSVAYLKMSLVAWTGGCWCASCTLLSSVVALAPLGDGSAPSGCCVHPGVGPTHDVRVLRARPSDELVYRLVVQ
jgi:hypothetical protein